MRNIFTKISLGIKWIIINPLLRLSNRISLLWVSGLASLFVLMLSTPRVADAQGISALGAISDFLFSSDTLYAIITKSLSYLGNGAMMLASAYLRICGVLLNAAVNLTMNISWFVSNNDAIKNIWVVIRDFSSIFFIAMLIYASIKLIIGVSDSGVKKTILSIVAAGLLVNFSLFITKVGIDASNIATLAIYRAIAPGEVVELGKAQNGLVGQQQQSLLSDNGLANVFMGLLRIQTIYDPATSLGTNQKETNSNRASVALKIITASVMGTAIMIIAGTNFAIIALVFLARFAMLILLLIFSPIAFLGDIIPMTGEYAKMWKKELYAQLIFPPLYFIIIYVALRIMVSPQFQNITGGSTKGATFSAVFSGTGPIGIVIQYGIVIYLIIQALIIAKKSSNMAGEWAEKHIQKYAGIATGKITASFGSGLTSTVGRGASALRDSNAFKSFATAKFMPQQLGKALNSSVKQISNAKFGSEKGYGDRVKEYSKDAVSYAKDMKKDTKNEMVKYDAEIKLQQDKISDLESHIANITNHPDIVAGKAKVDTAKKEFEKAKMQAEKARLNGSPDAAALSAIQNTKQVQYNDAKANLTTVARNVHVNNAEELSQLKAEKEALQSEIDSKYGKTDDQKKAIRSNYESEEAKKYQRKIANGEEKIWFTRRGKVAAKDIRKEIDKGKSEQELDALKKLIEDIKAKP